MPQQPEFWGTEKVANTTTSGNQEAARVVGLEGGGFVVIWQDDSGAGGDTNKSVKAQIYNAFGGAVGGEFLVNTSTVGNDQVPDVAALAGGGFVAVWQGDADLPGDSQTSGIGGQIFSATGAKVGSEFLVNTVVDPATEGSQTSPRVAALDSGGFAVVYESSESDTDIRLQRFDANGVKSGTQVTVNTTTAADQSSMAIAALGNSRFAVIWQDSSATGGDMSGQAIRYQIYEDDGDTVGTEQLANTATANNQVAPAIAGNGSGGFLAAWLDASQDLDASFYLAAQRFDANGSKTGDDFLVNDVANPPGGGPGEPELIGLADGTYFAAWLEFGSGTTQVFGQYLAADGSKIGNEFKINTTVPETDASSVSLSTLADGRIAVAWSQTNTSLGADTSGKGVRFQILDGRAGTVTGSDNSETLLGSFDGSGVNDSISAAGGNDLVYGFDGDDSINGGSGNDTMYGGAGNDGYIIDSSGDVAIEAAGGGDADFVFTSVSYTMGGNIETGRITGAGAINLTGNAGANKLTGNASNNLLNGGGANDVLVGDLGNDTLDGGTGNDALEGNGGNDTYIVDNSADKVTELASAGTDTVKASVTYTLAAHVENGMLTGTKAINFTGNGLANTLTGNAKANALTGAGGNDVLKGEAGNDTLDGGAGSDRLYGGLGNDTYVLSNGTDKVVDTGGVDTLTSLISRTLATLPAIEKVVLLGAAAANVTGNAQANTLTGNTGANVLDGGVGNDTLEGGAGGDTLVGGSGKDRLTGGAGADKFVFNAVLNGATNVDTITDFSVVDDIIHLENTGAGRFTVLPSGALAASAFAANASGNATDADDRIVYSTTTGALFYDSNGSAAGGKVQFAVLTTKPLITEADFLIV